ncbi:MAG TPA: glycoside hydrolase family 2 protein [Lacisediminihabitans sp.]|uniref:glycoside hydrolase family 2 protein n=1 Tax=Lacisediminihabitans sp. TaxID=2787631 RepID=UPI002EDA6CB1
MQATYRPLTDGWSLRLVDTDVPAAAEVVAAQPIPATVPGSVHTDLLAAGLIPDPYLDLNELVVDWVGRRSWAYSTTFDWHLTEGAVVELVCDGLDTIATITLNGRTIATTANMHRRYRFPLGAALVEGTNALEVTFASAWDFAEAAREEQGALPNAYPAPFNFIRKMACSFGWDWGPTTVTSGIWRPIGIAEWSGARLGGVRPEVGVSGDTGTVRFGVDLVSSPSNEGDLTLTATIGGQTTTVTVDRSESSAALEIAVPQARLWWPLGLGDQPLYEAQLVLSDGDGRELDRWTRRLGFRTVSLDVAPDADGSPFTVVVNNVAVPVRGANWIPDDAFPHRVDRARLERRLGQAVGANINLLRVWGGGVYESDEFYDVCDELGIMVWQDFLFACAAYPEENPLRDEVVAEAEDNVERLMSHPSLVLWNGNNENIWGWFDWDWQQHLRGRTWGLGYYLDLLPAVVSRIDPTRPYWPGSPYSGSMDIAPNADDHGLRHVWDVWNEKDYTAYRDVHPRFVSEFGWQGPPTWATLTESVHDDPLLPDSPGVLHHQKANDGNGKLARGLAPHLPEPRDMQDWHFLTQVNQARAVSVGIEHFRSERPRCMGTIVWQLNDCWPVTSWAAVDGYGRLKPLWYALRSSYATRLLTIQPRGDGLSLVAVNDGGESWREPVVVRRMDLDGTVLAEFGSRSVVDRFGSAELSLPADVVTPGDPARELIVATSTTGVRALWFFAEDKDLALPAPRTEISVRRLDDGVELTIRAATLVKDLCVFADRVAPDAVASDMLVTLLPGETRIITVTGVDAADAELLTRSPVLRSLGDVLTAEGTRLS